MPHIFKPRPVYTLYKLTNNLFTFLRIFYTSYWRTPLGDTPQNSTVHKSSIIMATLGKPVVNGMMTSEKATAALQTP